MTDRRIDKSDLIELVEQMPAFPGSVHRVVELASNINTDAKELVKVMEHDPVLTVKILKLVNSPYFGLSREITSIHHALVYVGLNTIKNLALSVAAIGTLPKKNKAGLNMNDFLLHSVATATISKLLAKKMGVKATELTDFFIAGLVHDIGKIVFAHFLPETFRDAMTNARNEVISLHNAEKDLFGVDHTALGSMLGNKWQLPDKLIQCIDSHHTADNIDETSSLLQDSIFVANQICKSMEIGYGGDNLVENLPEDIINRFGMELPEIIESLGNVNEELENAMTIIKV